MKKVVNSVLASALALSVAPMAFAAEDATTTAPKMDANTEKMVKRLEALGLVAGYGNGDYGVEKTITRAEFATLIVRARGLEQGAKLAQYNTTYTDVKTGDWFAGYVNVASGEEIVKGFPDKSFKPQNQVTYAEAVTMVVRALGYEPSVKGVWPNSMIAKASELNIAKGISNPNNAALRGDVFKMIDNALRVKLMEQVEFGTDIRFAATDKTLLTKYLKITVRDMDWTHESGNDSDDLPLVTNVPAIGLGKLKANEVTLSGKDAGLGNTTYKVAEGINPNEFDGQKVQVWIKDDSQNTIVYMEGSEDEEVVMDRVSTFLLKGKDTVKASDLTRSDLEDLKLELDASGKSYRFTKDTKVTYNFTRFNDPVDGLKAIITDNDVFGVKVVLNGNNEIAYIHVIDDQSIDKSKPGIKYGSKVISKIDVDKKRITNLDSSKFNELDGQDEGKDFIVFLDGKPAKLSDLKEQDVYSVYYADGDKDKFLVYATRNPISGKVEKVVSRNKDEVRLTVGGKTYKVYDNASYSEDANKNIKKIDSSNRDLISNLDGEEVKLLLDASGRIRHIETKDAIDDRKPKAIVTRQVMENTSKDTFDFVVLTAKGKKETISIDKKYIYDKDGVNYDKNGKESELRSILTPKKDGTTALLELSYDSKGEVDKVRILDRKLKHASGSTWNDLADEDDNAVGDYEVTDKTAIFKMTGAIEKGNRDELKGASTVKFKSIADQNKLDVYYSVDEDKAEVEAIFVVEGVGLGGDVQYGLVKQYGMANKQDTITVVTKEKDGNAVVEKEYKLDDDKDELERYRDIKRGDFIAFTLSSEDEVEVDTVVEVVDAGSLSTSRITNKAYPKVLAQSKLDTAGIDKLAVARVDKVDSSTITFNPEDGAKQTFLTKAATAYIDIFDDLEGKDGVDEGSYVVLIDTSDASGTRMDYVLIVADEDYIDKNDITEAALNSFLKQKTEPEGPGGWDAIDTNIEGKKAPVVGELNAYRVIAKLKSGVDVEDIETVEFYINGKLVDADDYQLSVKDGQIKVDYTTDVEVTSSKLKVTNAKGESDTATVTFVKA